MVCGWRWFKDPQTTSQHAKHKQGHILEYPAHFPGPVNNSQLTIGQVARPCINQGVTGNIGSSLVKIGPRSRIGQYLVRIKHPVNDPIPLVGLQHQHQGYPEYSFVAQLSHRYQTEAQHGIDGKNVTLEKG